MARNPIWWSTERKAEAVTLRQSGTTWQDIADQISAPSAKAVHGRMKREGLLGHSVPVKAYAKTSSTTAAPGFPKTKKCLKCGKPFKSQGPHNHLCGDCRPAVLSYGGDLETLYGG